MGMHGDWAKLGHYLSSPAGLRAFPSRLSISVSRLVLHGGWISLEDVFYKIRMKAAKLVS
jgi:hypothetical protein